MIDFEKLTNLIADKKCMSSDWNEKDDPFVGIYLSDLVDIINQCDSTKWISVDEALPPKEDNDSSITVIVHCQKGWCGIDYYRYKYGEWLNNRNSVTHWMQIPSLEGGEK